MIDRKSCFTKKRLIIYGDIHGCYDEFIVLRNKMNITCNDIEICVGDIITRGKYSVKTLDFIMTNNIKSVLGNHEDKFVRYFVHEKSGKKNPIILDEDELEILKNLNDKHLEFLQNLPLYLKFKNITILHGGLTNFIKLDDLSKKDRQKILRMRYLDENHNFLTYKKEDKTSLFWSDVYDGNQGFIIHGHQWFENPKITKNAIGIDTGCVYGNKLSAIVFENNSYRIISQKNMG